MRLSEEEDRKLAEAERIRKEEDAERSEQERKAREKREREAERREADYDDLKNTEKDTANKDKESGSSGALKAKLRELKDLLDEGLITEEEAAAKRAKLLEDM